MQLSIVCGRPTIQGNFDLSILLELKQWLASLDGHRVIDLSGMTFIDSSALRALLDNRLDNPHVRVVQPSEAVSTITGTLESSTAETSNG